MTKKQKFSIKVCFWCGVSFIFGVIFGLVFLSEQPNLQAGLYEPEESVLEGLSGGVSKESALERILRRFPKSEEFAVIWDAGQRNGLNDDDMYLLFAIRMAENGRNGRQFGIMHPKALDTDLDTQAGWCAATIQKNRNRWKGTGKSLPFIEFLGNRYCPPDIHPLNKNWIKNVKFWKEKLEQKGQ